LRVCYLMTLFMSELHGADDRVINEYLSNLSMALQPFVEPWPLFQFLNPIHSRQDSLDGGSARRKAATYIQNNTNTE
jgi:hypothetical protein